jgi:polysaccharide pyruvyl transferase WcaK-like protein
VPLPLQPAQDKELLDVFCKQWRALSREVLEIDTNALERPSQWIALLKEMDLVVAMRLHCAIMSLISAVPTVAIAYDPKVAHIADQFELPTLNLAKEKNDEATVQKWATTVTGAVKNRTGLSERSAALADAARNMACQNFTLLAKILKKHT